VRGVVVTGHNITQGESGGVLDCHPCEEQARQLDHGKDGQKQDREDQHELGHGLAA
jgi:hypothetical protein